MSNSHPPSKVIRSSPLEYLQTLSNHNTLASLASIVVHDPKDSSVSWILHVESNQLCYASSSTQSPDRLFCLLRECRPDLVDKYRQNSSELQWRKGFDEYSYLCDLLGKGEMLLTEFTEVLSSLTQEALINILSIKNTQIEFRHSFPLEGPIFWSKPLPELLHQVRNSVITWQCLRPYFSSPFTRLYLSPSNIDFFFNFWQRNQYDSSPHALAAPDQMADFVSLLNEQIPLYQAALRLRSNPVVLAQWLLPFMRAGVLTTLAYNKSKNPEQPLVVCVDDSLAVQTQVEMTLQLGGYQVLGITQPKHALNTLKFNNKRAQLIIMDINMPDQNGFQLCDELKQSGYLKDIPIIMLTGRNGLMDKVKAHMKGVKAFMNKPLDSVQLLSSVQQLLSV